MLYLPHARYFPQRIHRMLNMLDSLDPQDRTGSGSQIAISLSLPMQEAWNITRGERSIVVAILEEEIDSEELDSMDPRIKERIPPLSPPPETVEDTEAFHIGPSREGKNTRDAAKIAPGCSFVSVRIPSHAPKDMLADTIRAVSREADVLSCSWACSTTEAPLNSLLKETFVQRMSDGGSRGKGCVFCFPLRSLQSSVPNGGIGAIGCTMGDQGGPLTRSSSCEKGGISNAAALLAGVAALVISANPALTALEVAQILLSTADRIDYNRMDEIGPAIVLETDRNQYNVYPQSEWREISHVNAASAVAEAIRRRS
jgi:hypothetical protein